MFSQPIDTGQRTEALDSPSPDTEEETTSCFKLDFNESKEKRSIHTRKQSNPSETNPKFTRAQSLSEKRNNLMKANSIKRKKSTTGGKRSNVLEKVPHFRAPQENSSIIDGVSILKSKSMAELEINRKDRIKVKEESKYASNPEMSKKSESLSMRCNSSLANKPFKYKSFLASRYSVDLELENRMMKDLLINKHLSLSEKRNKFQHMKTNAFDDCQVMLKDDRESSLHRSDSLSIPENSIVLFSSKSKEPVEDMSKYASFDDSGESIEENNDKSYHAFKTKRQSHPPNMVCDVEVSETGNLPLFCIDSNNEDTVTRYVDIPIMRATSSQRNRKIGIFKTIKYCENQGDQGKVLLHMDRNKDCNTDITENHKTTDFLTELPLYSNTRESIDESKEDNSKNFDSFEIRTNSPHSSEDSDLVVSENVHKINNDHNFLVEHSEVTNKQLAPFVPTAKLIDIETDDEIEFRNSPSIPGENQLSILDSFDILFSKSESSQSMELKTDIFSEKESENIYNSPTETFANNSTETIAWISKYGSFDDSIDSFGNNTNDVLTEEDNDNTSNSVETKFCTQHSSQTSDSELNKSVDNMLHILDDNDWMSECFEDKLHPLMPSSLSGVKVESSEADKLELFDNTYEYATFNDTGDVLDSLDVSKNLEKLRDNNPSMEAKYEVSMDSCQGAPSSEVHDLNSISAKKDSKIENIWKDSSRAGMKSYENSNYS